MIAVTTFSQKKIFSVRITPKTIQLICLYAFKPHISLAKFTDIKNLSLKEERNIFVSIPHVVFTENTI